MRTTAIIIGLAFSISASAQNPTPNAAPQKQLDAVLDNWAKAMSAIQSLEATVERTTEDRVYGTKEVSKGTARFLRSQRGGERSRASLYLSDVAKPQNFEQFVLTPEFLFESSPSSKEIRAHELPKPQPGQNADNNFIGLLFGMAVAEAKKRYDIELKSDDPNYHVLKVVPRPGQGNADFAIAYLYLRKADHLPRQLVFQQVNKNVVRWDLPTIQSPANLRPADFDAPPLPPGWKYNRIPAK